jgi:SAM-dependent methyltransferase
MNRPALYREDLAFVHHEGFGDFARAAGPELLRLLRKANLRRGTLVDLACGSGLSASLAQRSGFTVIGVDQSPAMVRVARRVAPHARFHCRSLHDFELPACDVVTILSERLNYLSAGEEPVRRLDGLFARIAGALRPGGFLIFDVMVAGGTRMNYRNWREGQSWAVLFEVQEKPSQRLLVRTIVTFRKAQTTWRRAQEMHRLQLFTRTEVLRGLRHAGLSVRIARRYGHFILRRATGLS